MITNPFADILILI